MNKETMDTIEEPGWMTEGIYSGNSALGLGLNHIVGHYFQRELVGRSL